MSSSGAGTWRLSRSGSATEPIAFYSRSPVLMRRPFGVGAKNWPPHWLTSRRTASASLVVVGHPWKKTPLILSTLEGLVEPETAGDPMSTQKWVRSSLRTLSDRLKEAGHALSPPTVGRLLRKLDYSLRVNSKQLEARSNHPD